MKPIIVAILILLLTQSVGCSGGSANLENQNPNPITDTERALAATAGITSDQQILRGRELTAKLNSNGLRSGAYLYRKSMTFAPIDNSVKTAARLKMLGIYDIYLYAQKEALDGSNPDAKNWLKSFMATANQLGLTVWVIRFEDPSHYNSTGRYPNIDSSYGLVQSYNASVAENQKIKNYAADYEPQILKSTYTPWPSGIPKTELYFWNGTDYTTGSNNTLIRITTEMLQYVRTKIGSAPLNQAIGTMMQSRFDSGIISYGSAMQFLESCDYIITMSYFPTKEQIFSTTVGILNNAASKPKSVAVCIKPSTNDTGVLNPRTWAYMVSTIDYLKQQCIDKPAFRGVDFFEWQGLEEVWLTK